MVHFFFDFVFETCEFLNFLELRNLGEDILIFDFLGFFFLLDTLIVELNEQLLIFQSLYPDLPAVALVVSGLLLL